MARTTISVSLQNSSTSQSSISQCLLYSQASLWEHQHCLFKVWGCGVLKLLHEWRSFRSFTGMDAGSNTGRKVLSYMEKFVFIWACATGDHLLKFCTCKEGDNFKNLEVFEDLRDKFLTLNKWLSPCNLQMHDFVVDGPVSRLVHQK